MVVPLLFVLAILGVLDLFSSGSDRSLPWWGDLILLAMVGIVALVYEVEQRAKGN
jgi:hypothetical protein